MSMGQSPCGQRLVLEAEGPSSGLETTDFLTNSSGQATNADVSLFTKQCELAPAGYVGVKHCVH